jgi:hypothetical protein
LACRRRLPVKGRPAGGYLVSSLRFPHSAQGAGRRSPGRVRLPELESQGRLGLEFG